MSAALHFTSQQISINIYIYIYAALTDASGNEGRGNGGVYEGVWYEWCEEV
jgi:hypothetical protein